MNVHEISELSWEQVRDLDRPRTVAILPLGSVEAHGPHLPLGTDTLIGVAMAQEGARRLAERGVSALLLPVLPLAAAPFAEAFPGTLSISPGAFSALVADLASSLTSQGFGALAIANAHLDPAHLGALAEAQRQAEARGALPIACPHLTRRALAERLTDEFRSGACHAGRFESSIVMAVRPELVQDEVRSSLPAVPASLSRAIRDGASSFAEAGGPRAYFGDPAAASAEEGRASIATLGEILAEAALAALARREGL